MDIRRSRVWFRRSLTMASALRAAAKKTNIVRYPGSVKVDAALGSILPTCSGTSDTSPGAPASSDGSTDARACGPPTSATTDITATARPDP